MAKWPPRDGQVARPYPVEVARNERLVFMVRDADGRVVSSCTTFEQAKAQANGRARQAELRPSPVGGAYWEVTKARRWRKPRVLHCAIRAFGAPGDENRGGGASGVREPRRPHPGSSSSAVGLDTPSA